MGEPLESSLAHCMREWWTVKGVQRAVLVMSALALYFAGVDVECVVNIVSHQN